MSEDKRFKVKCLKAINISGVPYALGQEVMVNEKDAKELVIRKRVIALNFHIDFKKDANIVIVNDGLTKNQSVKIEEYKFKEEQRKKKPTEKKLEAVK